MNLRPLQNRSSRSAILKHPARRESVRHLQFETLENRTLLAADLSIVDVRLAPVALVESALIVKTDSSLDAANELQMALVTESSSNAADSDANGRMFLRLAVSESVAEVLAGTSAQVNVTFDSQAVALEATVQELDTILTGAYADAAPQSHVFQILRREISGSEPFVLEIPFRVIAQKDAQFSAQLITSSGSVYFSQTIRSDPSGLKDSVGPLPTKSDGIANNGSGLDGTIRIEPWRIPDTSPLLSEPDTEITSGLTSTLDAEFTRSFKSIAEDNVLSPRQEMLLPSSLSLSPDASWHRHRPLLLLGSGREFDSLRSRDHLADPFSTRLLNPERSNSKPSRSEDSSLDWIFTEKPGRTSPRELSVERMFNLGKNTQLEAEETQTPRVTILSASDRDMVLSQWGAQSPSTTRQKD